MIVKSAEPTETSRWVRSPASRSCSWRSKPTAPPSAAARSRRRSACQPSRVGTLLARSSNGLLLEPLQLVDAFGGQIQQLVEPGAVERNALGSRLHLDEAAVARHHHVHVDVGGRVLRVVEVEQGNTLDDA